MGFGSGTIAGLDNKRRSDANELKITECRRDAFDVCTNALCFAHFACIKNISVGALVDWLRAGHAAS